MELSGFSQLITVWWADDRLSSQYKDKKYNYDETALVLKSETEILVIERKQIAEVEFKVPSRRRFERD